jgi:hypothetical protein
VKTGFGKCPWRLTDAAGNPKSAEYNGWDIQYYMSKAQTTQRAMYYRIIEINSNHPARMERADREAFFDRVDKGQRK